MGGSTRGQNHATMREEESRDVNIFLLVDFGITEGYLS